MIPVTPMPEPADFDTKVRQPGRAFLATNPKPTSKDWKPFWQEALDDLRTAYSCICAYSATWIPHSTGSHSVDHYLPKDSSPNLAYEWTNFRYASGRFNGRKWTKRNILDPFLIQNGWFQIDFGNMLIHPSNDLVGTLVWQQVYDTIKELQLNIDDKLVEERVWYVQNFRNGDTSFDYLKTQVPFIAFEMRRQGLHP